MNHKSTRLRQDASKLPLLALAMFSSVLLSSGVAAEYSSLWGRQGEPWTTQSRLPDFSYAGYHNGEQPLPTATPGVSVKQFGAQGDGVADDSQAFLTALAEVKTGAIEIPPGRYKITKILEITRSGVVLRGAGPDKSVLYFSTPLNDITGFTSAAMTTGLPISISGPASFTISR